MNHLATVIKAIHTSDYVVVETDQEPDAEEFRCLMIRRGGNEILTIEGRFNTYKITYETSKIATNAACYIVGSTMRRANYRPAGMSDDEDQDFNDPPCNTPNADFETNIIKVVRKEKEIMVFVARPYES